jgi:cytochrome P450
MGRQLGGILQVGPPGLWSVFSFDGVSAILRDQALFSSERDRAGGMAVPGPRTMLGADPPEHTRLRGLVQQAFTPRMVESMAPRIREIARELLDAIDGRSTIDAVESFTYPLPVIVISEMLGVPAKDRELFKRWSDEVVSTLGGGIGEGESARGLAPDTLSEMSAYLSHMVELRRYEPRDDLITGLVRAEHEGSRLTFDEMLSMLILLLVAGNETTTNLIGNALQLLAKRPGDAQRLRDDPALLPSAVEEVVRFESPVQATARRVTRAAEFMGKQLGADNMVLVFLASANRDAAAFPDPDTFDIARTPNRHLGFAQGVHYCLGAPLARLEATIALEAFLGRYREFARVDDAPLPRVPTFIMRGLRSLPLAVL